MSEQKQKMFECEEARPFYLKGSRHGILLIHGFTGSVAHMRYLGEKLHAEGFTVMGINLPGHAVSIEAMAKTGWKDWLGAAEDALKTLRADCDTVTAAGLSMGGVISLILAEKGLVDSVISISAPMAAQNRLLALAGVLSVFMPVFRWGDNEETDGPAVLDPKYHLGYDGFPTRCGHDLYRLIQMARKNLGSITCPLMSIQSHSDESISADSLDVIQRGAGSAVKRKLWLDGVPHVCVISREKDRIAEECAAFLRDTEKQG